ncbi:MAG: CatA-like O-acetyltransferase, partial [Anaerotignum sp.]
DTMEEHIQLAAKTAKEQQGYFTGSLGDNVFQCSALPWIAYAHISHTNSGKRDNATPLFDWGRYQEKDGKIILPVSVQAHHSFVDGIHVGQFADRLQAYFNEF